MPYNSTDNTRVNRPLIQEPIKYKLLPGEVKLPSGLIIKVKLAELSQGSSEPKVLRDLRYEELTRLHELQKLKEREAFTMQGLTAPLLLMSASHIIGSANSDKPFLESYLGDSYNSATGNMIGDFALDLVTPAILAKSGIRTFGIINNLRPQNIRNHLYVAKPPIGYSGIQPAVKRWVKGILSGKEADIDNPWWFNQEYADLLASFAPFDYFFHPEKMNSWTQHALEARADAWRMYNKIPLKYNTFTPNPRHPGSFTDIKGIENLEFIDEQVANTPQKDFINSVGGNIGIPKIKPLGVQSNRIFGVTTTSDRFDLHPFSRNSDKLRKRFIHPIWSKYVSDPLLNTAHKIKRISDQFKYNPEMFPETGLKRKIGNALESVSNKMQNSAKVPEFKFLKPLEDKLANFEVSDLTGGKPFLVQYDIPWTKTTSHHKDLNFFLQEDYEPGFISSLEHTLPPQVDMYKRGLSDSFEN